MMTKRFQDKVVIVTGSSSGIGRGVARLFAEEGAKLLITGRDATTLEVSRQICLDAGCFPSSIVKVQGDLLKEETQDQIVGETIKNFGRIDILISNAGAMGPDGSESLGFDQAMAQYDYTMGLNSRASLSIALKVMPYLIKSQGELVFVTSIAGLDFAAPNFPFYATSKAALNQLMRALAIKYIYKGVRINAVTPGLINTPLLPRLKRNPEEEAMFSEEKAEQADRGTIPTGFMGSAHDVAEAVAFLADRPKSRYIVGSCLIIDGGTSILNPLMRGEFMDPKEEEDNNHV